MSDSSMAFTKCSLRRVQKAPQSGRRENVEVHRRLSIGTVLGTYLWFESSAFEVSGQVF